jgi:hypothetical protein
MEFHRSTPDKEGGDLHYLIYCLAWFSVAVVRWSVVAREIRCNKANFGSTAHSWAEKYSKKTLRVFFTSSIKYFKIFK